MPEDQWSPGADEVEIPVLIDVPDPGALAARDEGRRAPDRTVGPNGTVDPAGDQSPGGVEEGLRTPGVYDDSWSRSNASASTARSSMGSGLSRSARMGPCRKLAVSAWASSRII